MERKHKIALAVGSATTASVVTCLLADDFLKMVPDRYLVAYAPEWLQKIAFEKDTTAPLPEVSSNYPTLVAASVTSIVSYPTVEMFQPTFSR